MGDWTIDIREFSYDSIQFHHMSNAIELKGVFGTEDALIVLEGPNVQQHLHLLNGPYYVVLWSILLIVPKESALQAYPMSIGTDLFDKL